jgi:hypothetical protein
MDNPTGIQQVPLTPGYLVSLSPVTLTELLLHRNTLFMAAVTTQIKDKEYIESLKNDIQLISAVIQSKEGESRFRSNGRSSEGANAE